MSRKFALSCVLVLIFATAFFAVSPTAAAVAPLYDASHAPTIPSYTISGTVRDGNGAPMRNAHVQTGYGDPVIVGAATDADGAYVLILPAGVYHINVSQYGLISPLPRTVTVPPSATDVDFTFQPHYSIRGIVRDWDGTPMTGVLMRAHTSPSTIAETFTDATGAYTLTVIAGLYWVSADMYPLPSPPTHFITVPPDVAGIDFTFPQRYTISGAVFDHLGTPVAGAYVYTASGDPIYCSANTGNDGRYSLTVIAGVYHLVVFADGVTRGITRTVTVPPDAFDVDVTLPERYQVTGTVRNWDGALVADARIYAGLMGKEYAVASGLTDAAGVYTLALMAETYQVSVYKDGFLSPPVYQVTVPPAQSAVDLTFSRPYAIRGIVRNADGTTMADVTVAARQNYWTKANGRTDAAGAYTLTVAAGAYDVVVDSYPLPAPPAQTVSVPPDATAVDFIFPQRYMIRGVVRYYDDQPVDRARIILRVGDGTSNLSMMESDATGTYAFTVVPGVYSVVVGKDNLQAPPARLVTVPPDAGAVDFTLPQHYTLTGAVHDWTGAAAAYAGVSALTANDKIAASAETDRTGNFQIRLNAGTYRLRARRAWQPATPEVVVTVPPSAAYQDLILPQPYTIQGTVRDHTGAPVGNAEVFIRKGGKDGAATRTAGDGTYTLLAPAGKWVVHAELSGVPVPAVRFVETPPDVTGVDFTLPAPAQPYTISGVVRDQYGNPLAGAIVYGGLTTGTTAADGTYTITARSGVSESAIEAHKPGYKGSGTLLVPMRSAATGVNFILHALDGMIFGQALDFTGFPVPGARVSAWNAICPNLGGDATTTDASGAYTITVPIGPYRVYLYADGYTTPIAQEIELDADGGQTPAQVNFKLTPLTPPPFIISGRVLDSVGQPITNAGVQASSCGLLYSASGDATGAYTLPVTAGTYALYAFLRSPPPDPSAAGSGHSLADAAATPSTVFAGTPNLVSVPPSIAGVDITLTPSAAYAPRYIVRGRVTDDRGWPIEGAFVSSANPQNVYYETEITGANGIFALELLAGSYRISAYKPGYARPASRQVAVPTGQIGVDLTLTLAPERVAITISGTVRNTQGQPAAYADICTEPVGADIWWGAACQQVYYDGTYSLSLEPGTYRLFARDMDTCAAPSEAREIAALSSFTGVDFIVRPRDQLVTGRVTDTLGRPICGAEVAVGGEALPHTTTDGWGMYALPVPAGAYTLTATKPGYGLGADQFVIVPPRAASVNFVLPLPVNLIQGTVRDRRGGAVAGATIQISGPMALDPTATAADGRYTAYAPDGEWRVAVNKPGYMAFPAQQFVSLPPSPSQADFALIADTEVRRLYLPVLLR